MTYMYRLAFLLAFLVGCAAPPDEQPVWMLLLERAQELAFLILTPVLLLLGQRAVAWINTKLRIERADALDEQADILIRRGISYADEQARKALNSGKPCPPGQEKMAEAVIAASAWIKESDIPALTARDLERRIEAVLGEESERPRFNTLKQRDGEGGLIEDDLVEESDDV
jgi:hypothetical protein